MSAISRYSKALSLRIVTAIANGCPSAMLLTYRPCSSLLNNNDHDMSIGSKMAACDDWTT